MVGVPEAVGVAPVGDDHAVPIEVALEPVGDEVVVGTALHAVEDCRIGHHAQGAVLDDAAEGFEVFLTQVLQCDGGGRAVDAVVGDAVAHVVLQCGARVIFADVVGIRALDAVEIGLTHHRGEQRVLAHALVAARPTGLAAEVEVGAEDPAHTAGTALVGCHLPHLLSQQWVEGCCHADVLGEECAAGRIG